MDPRKGSSEVIREIDNIMGSNNLGVRQPRGRMIYKKKRLDPNSGCESLLQYRSKNYLVVWVLGNYSVLKTR